jgi:hypothetical protein
MDDWGSEGVWRAFGVAAILGIAGSHACAVLGARRPSDTAAVLAVVYTSLVLAVLDTVGGVLPVSGLVEDVDEEMVKFLAATLVLLVLTTVLPPILRRMQRPSAGGRTTEIQRFAGEVEEVAERIAELNRGPSHRAPEIRREVERLRDLARSFQP